MSVNSFTHEIEMKNYAFKALSLLYGRGPCNTEKNFKSGADLRYPGCGLIRSSMAVTPARRDVYIG